ncbi:unnamed protein product [Urochloa humidicola]
MEAPKALLAENPADDARPPLMVVLERAGDGTWVATPDYGDDQAPPPRVLAPGGDDSQLGNVNVGSTRAYRVRYARWALACTIHDFKVDVKELIHDYLNLSVDVDTQRQRMLDIFHGEDECARHMLSLPFVGLLEGGDGEPVVDEAAAELLRQAAGADADEGDEDGGGEGPLRFVWKELSAAGFVDARHMRTAIKVFFDGNIDVDDEDADNKTLTCFRASFMYATGFVNRLWDVRRIIEAYLDDGLDLETRRETIARRLGELEEVLNARARAVSTRRLKLID